MKKINLNDIVKVRLTPHGVDIYYNRFDGLNESLKRRGLKPIKNSLPEVDKNGYTRFQLWDFINIYGEYIGLAKENVITDLCLYIDEKDLEEVEPED